MGSKKDYHHVSHPGLVKLLAGIGAIITIIVAIFMFPGFNPNRIICGILLLLFGILTLISLFGSHYDIPFNALLILVLGIIILVMGFVCGGLFVIIAGILIIVAGIIGML